MKNEDKIVELLSEMLQKHDNLATAVIGMKDEIVGMKDEVVGMKDEIRELSKIQIRQEALLIKMLEIMDDDVPKFDQVIDIENLKDGSVILKKHQ